MSIWTRIKAAWYAGRSSSRERWYPLRSFMTGSSVRITPEQAMRISAVFAATRLLSETIASLPLHVYQDLPSGGKEINKGHRLYRLLHDTPNRWQTSFEFREMMQGHLCLRGNAYAEIISDAIGWPDELIPLNPDRITIERLDNGLLRYLLRDPNTGAERRYNQEDILHVRGFGSDGVKGLSPIGLTAETMGAAIAAEEMESSFYRNGQHLGNVLEHPGELGKEAKNNLEDSLQREYGGPANANRTLILEEGMKWHRMGVIPKEAQYIETRKFKVSDIARIFRVPPHLIGDLEKATFSNIEHQALEFVTYSLLPWLVRWEQAIRRDIIPEADTSHSARFVIEGLLRGDAKGRSEALQIQFQNGVINQDEWRAIENRNPLPNGEGQKFYVQLNLSSGQAPADNADASSAWLGDIARRITAAEAREIERQKNTPSSKFGLWLFNFYRGKHKKYISDSLTPYLAAANVTEPFAALTQGLTVGYVRTLSGLSPVQVVSRLHDTRQKHIADAVQGFINEVSKCSTNE